MQILKVCVAAGVIACCAFFWWGTSSVFVAMAAQWQMPPAQFDHEPTGPYRVRYQISDMFPLYCGTNQPKVGGCTVLEGGTCYITIRTELGAADARLVLRHEKAHCNGWPRNHSGGPFGRNGVVLAGVVR
jgi:hypothetical protein